jgi:hypothetical protein
MYAGDAEWRKARGEDGLACTGEMPVKGVRVCKFMFEHVCVVRRVGFTW